MGETVTCSVCGVGLGERFRVSFYGRFCSETCSLAALKRREALYGELLVEPVSDLPEHLSVADFERFALKLALHGIRDDAGTSTSSDPARAIIRDVIRDVFDYVDF